MIGDNIKVLLIYVAGGGLKMVGRDSCDVGAAFIIDTLWSKSERLNE